MPNNTTNLGQTGPSARLINEKSQKVDEGYFVSSALKEVSGDDSNLAQYFKTLSANLVRHVYVESEVEDASNLIDQLFSFTNQASNQARMDFMRTSANKALRLAYNVSEGNTLAEIAQQEKKKLENFEQLGLGIEALRSAAYFGCGQACQQLVELTDFGICRFLDIEICDLISAQIFWHEKSLTKVLPADAQQLPSLLELPTAWKALKENKDKDLYRKVMNLVFLNNPSELKKLIATNEKTDYINLPDNDLRFLFNKQIELYAQKAVEINIDTALKNAPMLNRESKTWMALKKKPSESYEQLLNFFTLLTSHLPNAENVMTPEVLAETTEKNPMQFTGYFADKESHVAIKNSEIDSTDKKLIQLRNDTLFAVFSLRHGACKKMIDDINQKREEIKDKKVSNLEAENKNKAETAARKVENEEKDFKSLNGVKITSKHRGYLTKQFWKEKTESYCETNGRLHNAIKENNDCNITEYTSRLQRAESQQDYQNYKKKKEKRQKELKEMEDKHKVDASTRKQELQHLISEEKELIGKFAAENPLSKAIELILLVAAQDFAVFGTLTNESKDWIADLIRNDLQAFLRGEFATTETDSKGKALKQKLYLPLVVAANSPAYLVFLQVAFEVFFVKKPGTLFGETSAFINNDEAIEKFWIILQDRLFDESGAVTQIDSSACVLQIESEARKVCNKQLSKGEATTELNGEIARGATHYRCEEYSDSLSTLLNGSKLLALFISVNEHIFPNHNANYSTMMGEAKAICTRLSKIIARPITVGSTAGTPSALTNYLQLAMVAMLDKQAISLLLRNDKDNPWYGFLLENEGIAQSNFACDIDTIIDKRGLTLKAEIIGLSTRDDDLTTAANIKHVCNLLTYLKEKLAPIKRETEVHSLVIEFLFLMLYKQCIQYDAINKTKNAAEKFSITSHVEEFKKRRAERAKPVKALSKASTSSSVSTPSPEVLRKASSSGFLASDASVKKQPSPPPPRVVPAPQKNGSTNNMENAYEKGNPDEVKAVLHYSNGHGSSIDNVSSLEGIESFGNDDNFLEDMEKETQRSLHQDSNANGVFDPLIGTNAKLPGGDDKVSSANKNAARPAIKPPPPPPRVAPPPEEKKQQESADQEAAVQNVLSEPPTGLSKLSLFAELKQQVFEKNSASPSLTSNGATQPEGNGATRTFSKFNLNLLEAAKNVSKDNNDNLETKLEEAEKKLKIAEKKKNEAAQDVAKAREACQSTEGEENRKAIENLKECQEAYDQASKKSSAADFDVKNIKGLIEQRKQAGYSNSDSDFSDSDSELNFN